MDRDQITSMTTAAVTCTLSDEEASALPAPQGTESFHVDPHEDSGSSLSARFGRLFGRGHWIRDT